MTQRLEPVIPLSARRDDVERPAHDLEPPDSLLVLASLNGQTGHMAELASGDRQVRPFADLGLDYEFAGCDRGLCEIVLLSSCPLPHSSHLVAALPNALRGRQSKDQGSVAQDVGGALTATGESPSAVRSQTVCERWRRRVRASWPRSPYVSAIRNGAPGEIRTPDPLVRSQVLYPAELRARNYLIKITIPRGSELTQHTWGANCTQFRPSDALRSPQTG